ncbi:MBL fold metallo-hydrolase [Gemmiger sp. An120]|uniref:MBL fold metallo-hydrolase n=1 Tax=Gemmiger TaxID=204475 RepID=UPI001956439B|nr:MBL fold metallo-hydrolase [Gemmiger sp. An120]HIX33564.1 MBL fold metallo-hydrolase [Candidatus Gemmiger avium]
MKLLHLTGPAPYFTNSFLLVSGGEAAIIDPAPDAARFAPLLEKENARLTHILLTHGHFDHVYGLDSVRAAWPAARLCLFRADAVGTEDRPVKESPEILWLTDGQTLTVGQAELTVLHTPGHTPGSCCWLCEGVLVSGDTLFAGSAGRTDLPGGDWETLMRSLRRLADDPALPDELRVLPGHGAFTTLGLERAQNPYMKG